MGIVSIMLKLGAYKTHFWYIFSAGAYIEKLTIAAMTRNAQYHTDYKNKWSAAIYTEQGQVVAVVMKGHNPKVTKLSEKYFFLSTTSRELIRIAQMFVPLVWYRCIYTHKSMVLKCVSKKTGMIYNNLYK